MKTGWVEAPEGGNNLLDVATIRKYIKGNLIFKKKNQQSYLNLIYRDSFFSQKTWIEDIHDKMNEEALTLFSYY